jgi:hypothetical protein
MQAEKDQPRRYAMNATPATIYGFTVRQMPMGTSAVPLQSPVVGVLHTTEGATADGAAATFHANNDAPHFAVDAASIIQFRPLDQIAMCLRHDPAGNVYKGETNLYAVQIEIAGFSKTTPWLPDQATVNRVAAVMAYASLFHGFPLAVPNNWPDDCSDMPLPWACRNARRIWAEADNNWPNVQGWWMHMEVPGQAPSFHWDCGAIGRTALITAAEAYREGATPP